MFEEDFARRLSQLRLARGVSARDMSLSIGQNAGYVNSIENRKALPSMSSFFALCDFLGVTPGEFFDTEAKAPEKIRGIVSALKHLDDEELASIQLIATRLAQKKA